MRLFGLLIRISLRLSGSANVAVASAVISLPTLQSEKSKAGPEDGRMERPRDEEGGKKRVLKLKIKSALAAPADRTAPVTPKGGF